MHLICCCDPYVVTYDVELHFVLLIAVNQDNMAFFFFFFFYIQRTVRRDIFL